MSLFNMAGHIQSLDGPASLPVVEEPFFTYSGHRAEGFAMDWSPLTPGQCVWQRHPSGCANHPLTLRAAQALDGRLRQGHFPLVDGRRGRVVVGGGAAAVHGPHGLGGGHSVERQGPQRAWHRGIGGLRACSHPSCCPQMFASCSVDRTVKLWDLRKGGKKKRSHAVSARAHDTDVNVISFNPCVQPGPGAPRPRVPRGVLAQAPDTSLSCPQVHASAAGLWRR